MFKHLPADWLDATPLGRLQTSAGPTPILLRSGRALDITVFATTTSDFAARWSGQESIHGSEHSDLGALGIVPAWDPASSSAPLHLLSPLDLRCIKASGVTVAISAVERVIEPRARGDDAKRAPMVRDSLPERIGADIGSVKPGSVQASRLKDALIAEGLWSQYLEVAIGPDAEIFTKAPVLSSVGWGDWIGVRSDSDWNNPKTEIVLVCDPVGRPFGATLGNDVNLRDIEGRSALLLGKASNASCAIGPFICLFDAHFTLDDVRESVVGLAVDGEDGFHLAGHRSMALISRDPLELIGQTIGRDHQYPDGFALFLGTMFAPVDDRDVAGRGFTHRPSDVVRAITERLRTLQNKVTECEDPRWEFGLSALMNNLAARRLLEREHNSQGAAS